MKTTPDQLKILSIDIGGSHIKATILNSKGELLKNYEKVVTPIPASPENVIKSIKTLVKDFPEFDKISVGFPGYVKNGVIKTAPNLGTDLWKDYDFAKNLGAALGKEARVVNDADMQGLGVVNGKGLELVITLGTGFGTAVLLDGNLLPHLEFSHQPFGKSASYDKYIGEAALEKEGVKKWNKRMQKVFEVLKTVFNYDYLYIGGGNSDKLSFKLDKNMKIVSNADGIKGGSRLWKLEEAPKEQPLLTQ
ncbi:polyphosphate glucokinase [Mucilaginibacter frigoritolerans]|jgi:polyphosphate glucokinase|uniref:Polyphosphate glucokinase n=1 Tax=Mucilaginibacter frigoritolerans TaxID=652788 RepID=A0A562TKL4_9SPHI|nr:ROK family protein [Mucilaginibacter frigoritolerans]TWI93903.1 polyphosphate glucokinase [Mucilaginibacter frigoritolerans]